MIDLSKLNDKQLEAVRQTEGPLLILAGAGSGKTHALTYRVAWLLQNHVHPFNIVAITFTNKAAREMRSRVNALDPSGDQVWVSTFHSLCVRILRREVQHYGYDSRFSIIDADDAEKLIKSCVRDLNINEKQYPARAVMAFISDMKDNLLSSEDAAKSVFDYRARNMARVYELYQHRLKASNSMDFDDLIYVTVKMLVHCPDVLERYQTRFKYMLVDEFQDTNTSQYRLVSLLADKYKNLCVVGDDDQSIYGWRGANIGNILNFEDDFPGAKVIKLEQNYRSTQTILDAANSVISNNVSRKGKKLWTENEQGQHIFYFRAENDQDEGRFVCAVIKQRVSQGAKYSDFAVLYRINAQSRAIEDQLVQAGLPYRLLGGVRFYQRMEIKDILAYLKAIHNPFDSVSYQRIINVPKRGIGGTTVDLVNAYAAENDIAFYTALKEIEHIPGISSLRLGKISSFIDLMAEFSKYAENHSVTELLEKVLYDTQYLQELAVIGTEEAENRIANVNELVSKAAEFERDAKNDGADAGLAEFLEDVALVADVDNYEESEDAAVLMTLHSAKGLEFPCVLMVGVEEGLFPSYRSISSGLMNELEEERRLCYVGITRARRELYITTAVERLQHGQPTYNSPSRFINELPKRCVSVIS